jgi:hypothetical protein
MNEPGFRFCGSCGARQDSGVLAGEPGQPKLVSDGAGIAAGAAEMMRPRRLSGSAGMSAADSAGLAGRSRRPLAMLLVVDAALAIAGGLLLRAGLARPAEASAEPAAASSPSGAPATTSTSAPEEAAPGAVQAEPAQRAAEPAKPGAHAEAKAEAKPAPSDPPNPNAAPSAAAPASGFAPGEPTPGPPAAGAAAPGGAASDETPDKTPGAGGDAASDAAKKKKKADKAVRRTGAESPVDPYAPAADLSAQINKLFSKGQARLDKCHASMPRGADGAGPTQLTVSFRVMADGTLGGAQVVSAPAGSEMLSMCVQAELAKWRVQSGESGQFIRKIQFGKVR